MENKIHVLIAGGGKLNFIRQVYEPIKAQMPELTLSAYNLHEFNPGDKVDFIEHIYPFPFGQKKNIFYYLRFIPVLFYKLFWKDFANQTFRTLFIQPSKIGGLVYYHGMHRAIARWVDSLEDIDQIHLHYPERATGLFTLYLQKNYDLKLILWGSELYREYNEDKLQIQRQIFDKAQTIALSTQEMQFVTVAKFGAKMIGKIRWAKIPDSDLCRIAIDKIRDDYSGQKKALGQKFNLPEDKPWIIYGNNAMPSNNHGLFIEALLQYKNTENWHYIFPFTYPAQHLEAVQQYESHLQGSGISYTFITTFMSWEELACLMMSSRAFISGQTTDAASGFLREIFYAERPAIVGSWLPYTIFDKLGLEYIRFDNFDELMHILSSTDSFSRALNLGKNRQIIEEALDKMEIGKEWMKIIQESKTIE